MKEVIERADLRNPTNERVDEIKIETPRPIETAETKSKQTNKQTTTNAMNGFAPESRRRRSCSAFPARRA